MYMYVLHHWGPNTRTTQTLKLLVQALVRVRVCARVHVYARACVRVWLRVRVRARGYSSVRTCLCEHMCTCGTYERFFKFGRFAGRLWARWTRFVTAARRWGVRIAVI